MLVQDLLSGTAQYAGWFSAITAAIIIIVKPVRERVFGIKAIKDGMKCQLRTDMLRIYYHNKGNRTIRQYEYENFMFSYNAYKALKGNSFIDHIKREVDEWEVVT